MEKEFSENSKLLDAYFAGLIDGEGTIDVYDHKGGTKRRPVVKVNMACEATIRRIQEHFGGSVMPKKVYREHYKPQWHWIVTHSRAIYVASRIRPYMITKAALADKVLAMPMGKLYKIQGTSQKNSGIVG